MRVEWIPISSCGECLDYQLRRELRSADTQNFLEFKTAVPRNAMFHVVEILRSATFKVFHRDPVTVKRGQMNRVNRAAYIKIIAALIGVAGLAVASWLVAISPGGSRHAPSRAATARPSAPPQAHQSAMPATTTVAAVRRNVARYASPGRRATGMVPDSWFARPSVLPVIATRPGWVRVRLAQRPNGSSAWLPAKDVRLSKTPFRIVVNLATTHLTLYDHGRRVFSTPAGVGAPGDPTPKGEYFVAFDEQPPSPGYGAFIMVTSAHSPRISDWEGSGDAVIGIHGPLGMDSVIGTTGARISHGCIRLHEQALNKLAVVPPGTPIDVIDKAPQERPKRKAA